MKNILKEIAFAELRVDNISFKKQLDLNLSLVETTISQLSESGDVIILDMNTIDQISQRLIERMEIISQIYIMDSQGMQIYKSSYIETMGDRADRTYFQSAITGTSVFSDVIISRSTDIPISVFACPIYRDGKIDGVIGASIDLSYLSELSSSLRFSNDSYGFLIDLKGRVIGHPNPELVAEMTDLNYIPMVPEVLSGKTGVGEYVFEGVEKLVAYTPSEETGWGVLVQIPQKEAFKTITIFNRLLFLTAFLILLVSFVVVVVISGRLQKPVNDIIEIIDKIEGNQDLKYFSLKGNDEFGIIQKKLLSMDSNIKKYYIELEERVELRTAELQQTLTELEKAETEHKRLESQLLQAQKMESIGFLAGGIAHDFNNILSPIMGYVELTLDQLPQENIGHEYLNEVLHATERASDLVKQILTFSRKSKNERKPIECQPIIKEALKLLRSSIPSSIEIKQNIASNCGMIMADPIHIHQIIMNLCTNAFHSMEVTGGIISVLLDEFYFSSHSLETAPEMTPGSYICLTVKDTGQGMEKNIVDHIFDPYFTTKSVGKGSGLGLSIIYGIVQEYDGYINVSSEPGKGTEFKIYFPMIDSKSEHIYTENN
jgi:signal transduction histidine kinase